MPPPLLKRAIPNRWSGFSPLFPTRPKSAAGMPSVPATRSRLSKWTSARAEVHFESLDRVAGTLGIPAALLGRVGKSGENPLHRFGIALFNNGGGMDHDRFGHCEVL